MLSLIKLVQGTEQVLPAVMIRYMVVVRTRTSYTASYRGHVGTDQIV